MTAERLGPSEIDGEAAAAGEHLDRYRLAASMLQPSDRVVDASCGIGYGSAILAERAASVVGLDVSPEAIEQALSLFSGSNVDFRTADLDVDAIPECDVLATFETIEHLRNPEAFLARCRARTARLILVSTPVTPTTHRNPFHLHDLTTAIVEEWMSDWHRVYALLQSGTDRVVYGVWAFTAEPLERTEAQALIRRNLEDQQHQFWRHHQVLESLATWTEELDDGKGWLEQSNVRLQQELSRDHEVIADLKEWIHKLEESKLWLERQWQAAQEQPSGPSVMGDREPPASALPDD